MSGWRRKWQRRYKASETREEGSGLTNALHRIAARLRFGMNLKGLGLGGKR